MTENCCHCGCASTSFEAINCCWVRNRWFAATSQSPDILGHRHLYVIKNMENDSSSNNKKSLFVQSLKNKVWSFFHRHHEDDSKIHSDTETLLHFLLNFFYYAANYGAKTLSRLENIETKKRPRLHIYQRKITAKQKKMTSIFFLNSSFLLFARYL